jgi:SAM-dependent methyltransferase/chromosome segregation ATPase
MDEDFYYAFEERHRGSRELIKSRLSVYLPFLAPFKKIYEKPLAVIDLGCGRGEWLELMTENGFEPKGVDINDRMIEICRQKGFYVEKQDAVKALENLPSDSHVVVSAFHLVEHLPFNNVYKLVKEALRVLKPGGILILETPNPENLVVASANFYLDPSHRRPIPPLLLSFLVEHCGFFRHKILRLQESPAILKHGTINLWGVLSGVSPDYAVVAQKDAKDKKILSSFDTLFDSTSVGVTLDQLAMNYEQELEDKIKIANPTIRDLREMCEDLIKKNENLSHQLGLLTEARKRLEEDLEREKKVSSELSNLIEEVRREAEAERARANELGERLSEAVRSKEELSYQLGVLTEARKRLEEDLEREKKVSSELSNLIEEVRREAEAERARANELGERLSEAVRSKEELSYQLGVLTEARKRLEEELEREKKASSELSNLIEEVRREAEAERARANELGKRLSEAVRSKEELSYQLGVLTEARKRLEEDLEREKKVSSELSNLIEEVRREAEAERARANELGERLSEAVRSKEELSYQLGVLTEARKRLEEELEREKKVSSELSNLIEEVRREAEAERARANELEARCTALEHTVQALYRSWSWRITYPLRLGLDALRSFKRISFSCLMKIWWIFTYPVKWILARAIKFVLNRPRLREFLHRQLVRLPWIYWRLYNFAVDKGIVVGGVIAISQHSLEHEIDFIQDLSPRARQIYEDLKRAIENRRKNRSS